MATDDPTLFDWAEQQQPEVEYRDVPGFPGYRIGSDGSVWSRKMLKSSKLGDDWKRLELCKDRKGYLTVSLRKSGGSQTKRVHRLVMLVFVGPRPLGMEVCHRDGDHANNRLSNLRYDTSKANKADSRRHDTLVFGERVGSAKLTEADVRKILELMKTGLDRCRLAKMFGVNSRTILDIKRGVTWKHITGQSGGAT